MSECLYFLNERKTVGIVTYFTVNSISVYGKRFESHFTFEHGTFVGYRVGFITTVAFCGFRSVFGASRIAIGNVIRKIMTERGTVFISLSAFSTAYAGIVISRLFSAGCCRRQIFVGRDLTIICVLQFRICVSYRVGFIATVAFCGLRSVFSARCIAVRNIISKFMTESRICVGDRIGRITANTFCGF